MHDTLIRQYALTYPQRVAALILVDGLVQVAGAAASFSPPPMTGPAGLKARETMIRGMFGPATSAELQKTITPVSLATLQSGGFGAFVADNLEKYTVYLGERTPVEDRLAANIAAIYNNLDRV